MRLETCARHGTVVLLALALTGCALFGHHKPKEAGDTAIAAPAAKTAQDREAELRALVRNRVETAMNTNDEQRNKVIRRSPYFYRKYDVYPSGADDMKALMQEKESQSAPYIADVALSKQQFTTRLHRKRAEAEDDTSFLRDTGSETITFELRNGHWTRVGSIFIAEKSEENINGEWVPVKETAKRTIASEETKAQGGWFKRTWSKIMGKSEEEQQDKDKDQKPKKASAPGSSQSFHTGPR